MNSDDRMSSSIQVVFRLEATSYASFRPDFVARYKYFGQNLQEKGNSLFIFHEKVSMLHQLSTKTSLILLLTQQTKIYFCMLGKA